jgi:hypothetical protein
MSKNINGVPIICEEPDDICEECGKVAELRPYGENGKRICFVCGRKNPELTDKMTRIKLFGDPETTQ